MVADTINEVQKLIRGRLTELEAEARRLRSVLSGLDGARRRARGPQRRAGGPPASTVRVRRAPRGQRQAQFLDAVKKKPGEPMAEIAREMDVPPKQLYTIARRLREQGRIRKRGKGFDIKQ